MTRSFSCFSDTNLNLNNNCVSLDKIFYIVICTNCNFQTVANDLSNNFVNVTPTPVATAYPTTPHIVAATISPWRNLPYFLPLPVGPIFPANAAAVAGPPIAAFDATITSSSPRGNHFTSREKGNIFETQSAPYKVNRTCTSRASIANAKDDGPCRTHSERLADVPIEAKRR
mmetsp:Transcript_25703/g.37711  ORF Transcript_25703/g.37711 Transcript_25703/m.37711 type:complete len:172 (-) Transcript_25703:1506-2021(-)